VILFTLLMGGHALLHLASPLVVADGRRLAVYLAVQIALIVTLIGLSQHTGIVFGLIVALAGETVGMLQDWRRSAAAALGFLALLVACLNWVGGWQALTSWLLIATLMLLFVFIYVLLFVRQMNARQEAQKLLDELETANRQLAEYAQQVEQLTLQTERQRMARELHDTLAQGLAGLALQLEALEASLERDQTERAAQIAAQAKRRARATLQDARRAIGDLRAHPTSPAEAIRREAAQFTTITGIPCRVTLPDELALPEQQAEQMARCVREGLNNVARHAQATAVWLTAAVENGRVLLTLRDDGRGFDPQQTLPAGHYGLLGLRERARLAGGQFSVESRPGAGTTLRLSLPIQEPAARKE
ncbi:sensor histidine kinase, partial [Arthrospira platensis SPKY1]|nr:sensor histidine kinase [Arthrospira platensis SPKY1]